MNTKPEYRAVGKIIAVLSLLAVILCIGKLAAPLPKPSPTATDRPETSLGYPVGEHNLSISNYYYVSVSLRDSSDRETNHYAAFQQIIGSWETVLKSNGRLMRPKFVQVIKPLKRGFIYRAEPGTGTNTVVLKEIMGPVELN